MKFTSKLYAKALTAAMKSRMGDDEMAKNLLAMLEKNGDMSQLSTIVAEAERMLRATDGTRNMVVTSARPLDEMARELLKSLAKPGDTIEEKISPELLAGIKVLMNDELQFDGSLKSKLDTLLPF